MKWKYRTSTEFFEKRHSGIINEEENGSLDLPDIDTWQKDSPVKETNTKETDGGKSGEELWETWRQSKALGNMSFQGWRPSKDGSREQNLV